MLTITPINWPQVKLTVDRDSIIGILANLGRTTFYDTFHQENSAADMELFLQTNFNDEAIESELNDPITQFIIARWNNVPAGYVKLALHARCADEPDRNALEICRIYVAKEQLSRGVGKALMLACLDLAAELKKDIVWLGVWEHNPRAIQFYERFGFAKYGEHLFMLGNDAQTDWLMKKTI